MRYLNGGSLGPGIAFGEKGEWSEPSGSLGGGGGLGEGGGVDGGARRQVSDAADPPSSN